MRPKKPADEKLAPLTAYLRPAVLEKLKEQAATDRRTASVTAALMIEHALACHIYKQGHVPADQIPFLRGQKK